MKLFEYMQQSGHEQLAMYHDPATGLRALIAIHDTTLGPACGGVRFWPHPSEEAAIMDVLRLSRAMTYKSAAAGLPLGGGKGLIWGDPHRDKSEALLQAFGRFVDTLGGRYITTEDVGITPDDLVHISQATRHVVGLPSSMGGCGNTGPLTGLGVYLGMKACARATWGTDSLEGRVVAMQGFGNVGGQTAQYLVAEGVSLVVTDIYEQALERARGIGATIVEPEAIYDVPCDIFSPCALGGVLNDDTIPRLRCAIVAGAANNQLLEARHGEALQRRGILYAPDYIVNAGGIIQVYCEIDGPYDHERARAMVERIYDTTREVIRISRAEDIPTSVAADRLAERRVAQARRRKPLALEATV